MTKTRTSLELVRWCTEGRYGALPMGCISWLSTGTRQDLKKNGASVNLLPMRTDEAYDYAEGRLEPPASEIFEATDLPYKFCRLQCTCLGCQGNIVLKRGAAVVTRNVRKNKVWVKTRPRGGVWRPGVDGRQRMASKANAVTTFSSPLSETTRQCWETNMEGAGHNHHSVPRRDGMQTSVDPALMIFQGGRASAHRSDCPRLRGCEQNLQDFGTCPHVVQIQTFVALPDGLFHLIAAPSMNRAGDVNGSTLWHNQGYNECVHCERDKPPRSRMPVDNVEMQRRGREATSRVTTHVAFASMDDVQDDEKLLASIMRMNGLGQEWDTAASMARALLAADIHPFRSPHSGAFIEVDSGDMELRGNQELGYLHCTSVDSGRCVDHALHRSNNAVSNPGEDPNAQHMKASEHNPRHSRRPRQDGHPIGRTIVVLWLCTARVLGIVINGKRTVEGGGSVPPCRYSVTSRRRRSFDPEVDHDLSREKSPYPIHVPASRLFEGWHPKTLRYLFTTTFRVEIDPLFYRHGEGMVYAIQQVDRNFHGAMRWSSTVDTSTVYVPRGYIPPTQATE
ncbi:hypothetical protein BDN71DRAFT_1495290 [Pleurotus eryngii]|uniref:Uncharacterized protein n=1 Tax=Pleurotus eryngii TaxID=5323 RepID=A0A9P6D822_PLEER|nr:hypothetical protein BDN71DRAFT_1495290 [Pleurotus eryngii]